MIPIQNLYLMLCYAWDRLDSLKIIETGGLEVENLENLLSLMLADGVASLLKRGLHKEYVERADDMATLRGRVECGQSIQRMLFERGIARCTYDELSEDTLHNRIIKATVDRFARCESVDEKLRNRLSKLRPMLASVSSIMLDREIFDRARRIRLFGIYALMLEVCQLAFDYLVPEAAGSGYRATEFFRDEKKMWRVFQDFVLNYFRIEAKQYKVTSSHIKWDAAPNADAHLLPRMRTDVTLVSDTRHIILDTKYTPDLFKPYFRKNSLRSEHLYQILTYVDQQAGPNAASGRPVPEGILLYPAASHHFDVSYQIKGRDLRIATIDLQESWQKIKGTLNALIV
ncbi:5-methylcytosine-specific restriction enzyme subunit McrC [Caballeronia choica]|uniref:5-methylcytosine-specific restriction enzyme subunit McrC n=1 Tax=Caballeronia choica TaxID=326476 RepID=A0A158FCF0_9BURK|nr:hypothetical protein [Caballeronia choica]SAL17528.1 5-methylcytosine-specific restriction enzyme subunit McrC [Caballeronia choica]